MIETKKQMKKEKGFKYSFQIGTVFIIVSLIWAGGHCVLEKSKYTKNVVILKDVSFSEKLDKTKEKVKQKSEGDVSAEVMSGSPAEEIPDIVLLSGKPENLKKKFKKLKVVAANATSTISQELVDNSPLLMFDGKDGTDWQEGVEGYGIGESVSFSFGSSHKVRYMGFKLGNWKNDKYYYGNSKPKTITITSGNFSGQITFTGNKEEEWVRLDYLDSTDSMRITIDDVYEGTTWQDTCISEIEIYGE